MARPAAIPTQSQIAHALQISSGRVSQLKKRGMPVASIPAAREWYTTNIQPPGGQVLAFPVTPEGMSLTEARTKREAAEAARAELKLAEERGELVRADEVRSAWAGNMTSVRESLLQLASRLAPVVAVEDDQHVVHELIMGEVMMALEQMSQPLPSREGA